MDYRSVEATAREGVRRLEAWYHAIGLGTRLGDLQIGKDRLDEMARKCTNGDNRTVGNFVKLDTRGVRRVYELAL
jgi:alcohol dehydrogenase YqhD (iron-dependent ADH family)